MSEQFLMLSQKMQPMSWNRSLSQVLSLQTSTAGIDTSVDAMDTVDAVDAVACRFQLSVEALHFVHGKGSKEADECQHLQKSPGREESWTPAHDECRWMGKTWKPT